MNDDWRLHIDLHDDGITHRLSEALQAGELEHDLQQSFADKVVVSVDGSELFCYAGTRAQAEAAKTLIERMIAHEQWQADVQLTHWHPEANRWESPEEPLPTDPEHVAREREQRAADERAESAQQGYPEFEVRVACGSRGDARTLSERLDEEQIASIHRWNWVLIGAADEASAQQLAARLRDELPAQEITVERNARAVWEQRPSNPFLFLGGLAD